MLHVTDDIDADEEDAVLIMNYGLEHFGGKAALLLAIAAGIILRELEANEKTRIGHLCELLERAANRQTTKRYIPR